MTSLRQRETLKSVVVGIIAIGMAANSFAVPLSQIDIGDTYYINNLIRDNDLVVVKRIDQSRGLVKVQYLTGAVDWVKPSLLFTQSDAKDADVVEGVVGIGLAAGALWALIDPEGFKNATKNLESNSQPKKKPASTQQRGTAPKSTNTKVPIAKLPLRPLGTGDWFEQNQSWKNWTKNLLTTKKIMPNSLFEISNVRLSPLSFYTTKERKIYLMEISIKGINGSYFAVVGHKPSYSDTVFLDGTSNPLHKLNGELELNFSTKSNVTSYLEFFDSVIEAADGPFFIVDPASEYLSSGEKARLGIRPMTVSRQNNGEWKVESDMIYADVLFRAQFTVKPDGMIEIGDDTARKEIALPHKVRTEKYRRYYAAQSR